MYFIACIGNKDIFNFELSLQLHLTINLNVSEPASGFQIAFNMFDTDGNRRVDKNEFLVVSTILRNSNILLTKVKTQEVRVGIVIYIITE